MQLSHRIFLGYFVIVAIAGYFLLKSVQEEFKPAVRQSMEETLVDTANLLAEIVEGDLRNNALEKSDFASAVQDFVARRPAANIWGYEKNDISYRIYITDADGVVVYDSSGQAVGDDYSQWNDVYLTLRGHYGARSTKTDPNDESSSVMHVAAPIKNGEEIIGVMTVSKPNISVLPFIELSQHNILKAGFVLVIVALGLGWLMSNLIAGSARKLAEYAHQVQQGKKATLPKISEPELAQLGRAIESMRDALEGKEYVERYVYTLTHEIKSPLSGITGASELLSEEMEVEDRKRFIENIKSDTRRIQDIVDRLLELAKLEQQQSLENREPMALEGIVTEIVAANEARLTQKSLSCVVDVEASKGVSGDAFLVRQALNNVLDNAIGFSPEEGTVTIEGELGQSAYILSVKDHGEGVPDYAQDKIFERFYSLPRPETGKKSSGLGLSFVKEVMLLHDGDVEVSSSDRGACVTLKFPRA